MSWFAGSHDSSWQAFAFVSLFIWLSAAIGHRILHWLGLRSVLDAESALISIALGAGVLQIVPFGLGMAGLLHAWTICLCLLLTAVAFAFDVRTVLVFVLSKLRRVRLPERQTAIWLAALFPGLLIAVLLALAPTIDTDGLWYHLTVPKRWLASGTLDYLPTYPNSNMPMGAEMLFTIALAIAGDSAAKLLHCLLGICAAAGLYLAGVRLKSPTTGALAAVLYLFGPMGVSWLLGFAFIEGITSFATVTATLAWLLWYQKRERGWLYCAFLLAGIGVSFKITAGFLPLALAALTTVVQKQDARDTHAQQPKLAPATWLRLVAVCGAPVAPWLLRSAIVTGNPFFPLFATHIPSRDFPPALATEWEHFNRFFNWFIIIGRNWTLEQRQLILVVCTAVLVGLAGLACWRLRSWMARAVTLVLLLTILAQLATVGLYLRYWIPLASVLSLPILALFGQTLSKRWLRAGLILVTAALSLSQAMRSVRWADGDFSGVVRVALGLESRQVFLERHVAPFPLYEKINRDLPAASGVLLALYCGGFYIDRSTYCTDIIQGSIRMSDWQEFLDDLHRVGVTHVVAPRAVAAGQMSAGDAAGVGFMVQQREMKFVGRLLVEHGRLLASAGKDGLYELSL